MSAADTVDVHREIKSAKRVAPYVIDADAHVNPPPSMWADYLPKEFKDLAPVVEQADDGDYILFEGQRKRVNLIGAQAGREDGKDFKIFGRLTDQRTGGWMPPARIADMDRDGMDVALLYGGGSLGTANPDLFLASFSAYNRWLADFCSHDPKRLKGVAYIPTIDTDITIKLMREAHALGLRGVNISGFPMSMKSVIAGGARGVQTVALTGDPAGDRTYRDPEFDRLWATAVELDMPITFHLGARGTRFEDKANMMPDMVMAKLTMAEPIAIMMFGGVFDRFPALRVGAIEAGVSWFAWVANYMDYVFLKQRHWTESKLKETPSFYFDQNFYASFINEEIGAEFRHLSGCKNIMWSSDYPHSETSFPHSHEIIARDFGHLPIADRDWIIGGCAKKFYGLD